MTMQRIHSVEPAKAQGRTKELLETVETTFGTTPNVAKVMANSPAVLDSFLALTTAMGGAKIGGKLHHQIKLATSEANTCDYCNSILTYLGNKGGISTTEILEGRKGSSTDVRTDAALKFASTVLETRGKVDNNDLQAVREAGFDDTEIVEIVASVVVGCFTNFLNNVADTTLDIPKAEPLQDCATSGHSGCA
jgi:uncharacterized peroxidase-related enzyme